MLKIIKNVRVFSPEDQGIQDVLIARDQIAYIAPEIPVPEGIGEVTVIQGTGLQMLPGFIDGHVHVLGGGGEGGPATRTPEITLSQITRWGVTTLFGVLGTDGTTRSVESLLTKVKALELEGISTYCYR